jgi:glycine betaine/proline transport system permease protein
MVSPVGVFAEKLVDYVDFYLGWLLDLFGRILDVPLDLLGKVLYGTEPLILIAAILVISLLVTRRLITTAVITAAFLIILWMGYWNSAMITLNMVIVSATVAVIIAVPLGIWSARSEFAEPVIKTLMDFMQTMPAFVYLIPAVIFFGLGIVPGVIATVIFAMPPVVRLTNLGIRQVPVELDEVADAFGSTSFQKLTKVQLPAAMPSIMAGVNQCIMLSLSMVVIAAMIGGGGLGQDIVFALNRIDVAHGFEAGLAVVLIAIALDRLTQSFKGIGNGSEVN